MSRSVIFGCAGPHLTAEERAFFAAADPLGFIIFTRNIENSQQLTELIRNLRESVGRADAPVLIDQEGGRVQRLRPPYWRDAPAAAVFGALAGRDRAMAAQAVRINHLLIAAELRALGIDVDCAPLVDLGLPGAHAIIGDRAFGGDPYLVADLGRAAAEGLMAGGVLPIVKHIPGHGRAMVDSHLALPRVSTAYDTLVESDFVPFRQLNDMPWAMTAHIVYEAVDPEQPATLSPKIIQAVIREALGFDGLLLTDDLSMKALSGDLDGLAARALAAGCDVVLHCNGDMAEMRAVASGAGALSAAAARRYSDGRKRLNAMPETDSLDLAAELDALLASAAGG